MAHVLSILARIRSLASRTEGQTLVEYALILAILSIVLIVAFSLLSKQLIVMFSAMVQVLDTAQSSH